MPRAGTTALTSSKSPSPYNQLYNILTPTLFCMAEDQPAVISPMCPDCHRKNVRFNKTDNVFVCNLCGRIGIRDEFVKTAPT